MNNESLKAAYLEVLKDLDPSYLMSRPHRIGGDPGLSGLFLPSVSDNYGDAKNKVMIVGAETAGWEPLGKGEEFVSLSDYVDQAMNKHRAFFERILSRKHGDPPSLSQ